jgi:hypothetical protein
MVTRADANRDPESCSDAFIGSQFNIEAHRRGTVALAVLREPVGKGIDVLGSSLS